jgi:hypothetical protein
LSSSLLVLILHNWFSLVGPNIFRRIFLSNTNRIEDSFNTQVSEALVTIGRGKTQINKLIIQKEVQKIRGAIRNSAAKGLPMNVPT